MGVISRIRGPVRSVINMLLTDPYLKKVVLYRKFSGQTFDSSAGHTVDAYEDLSLAAVELRHNNRSVLAAASSEIQAGDLLYIFRAEDLPENYSMRDCIVSGGTVKKIKVITDIFDMAVLMSVDGT